jgi:hypothetical protein
MGSAGSFLRQSLKSPSIWSPGSLRLSCSSLPCRGIALGTSVQEIGILQAIEHASSKHVRCEYNQQDSFCSYSSSNGFFHEGEVQFIVLATCGHPFSTKPIFACFHHTTTTKGDMKELYSCTEQASTFFGALFGTSCSWRSDTGILSGLPGRALLWPEPILSLAVFLTGSVRSSCSAVAGRRSVLLTVVAPGAGSPGCPAPIIFHRVFAGRALVTSPHPGRVCGKPPSILTSRERGVLVQRGLFDP